MILRLLHYLASKPRIYDFVQTLAGARTVRRRIHGHTAVCGNWELVLDIGGGTGAFCDLLPRDCRYVCLDIEAPKLAGFKRKHRDGKAVLGDAALIPIAAGSIDVALCVFVSHHLAGDQLESMLRETRRVLRPNGLLVLVDPLLGPQSLVSTLLWRLDRGSHPRGAGALETLIGRHFQILEKEQFAVYHTYLLVVARKAQV